jgi:protein-disulfide isomerase
MTKALALTAVLTLLACSSSAQQSGTSSGSEVVARVGEREITLKQIEERWQKAEPAEHAEAFQKLYEGRRSALDEAIAEILFAEAAKGKGLSPAAYEEAELSKRAKAVTDADVASFYTSNLNEMQGKPLDSMAPLINRFLQTQNRAAARQALIAELQKSGPPVRVMLEAPRQLVAIEATDPSLGAGSAPVTIVEFSDFQCPFCQRASPTLKRVRQTYGDKVRLVWKDFPLTQIHPQAFKAAEAAQCAGEQGKFWEYHDRLFANQAALEPDALKKYAAEVSLDTARFGSCLDSSKFAERVRDGVAMGTRLGVSSTPTIFVNGRMLAGAYPYETFVTVIDEELEKLKKK